MDGCAALSESASKPLAGCRARLRLAVRAMRHKDHRGTRALINLIMPSRVRARAVPLEDSPEGTGAVISGLPLVPDSLP